MNFSCSYSVCAPPVVEPVSFQCFNSDPNSPQVIENEGLSEDPTI